MNLLIQAPGQQEEKASVMDTTVSLTQGEVWGWEQMERERIRSLAFLQADLKTGLGVWLREHHMYFDKKVGPHLHQHGCSKSKSQSPSITAADP